MNTEREELLDAARNLASTAIVKPTVILLPPQDKCDLIEYAEVGGIRIIVDPSLPPGTWYIGDPHLLKK